jgi:hypothetical protein
MIQNMADDLYSIEESSDTINETVKDFESHTCNTIKDDDENHDSNVQSCQSIQQQSQNYLPSSVATSHLQQGSTKEIIEIRSYNA